jgi:putative DNA primase/helicase
MSDKPHKLDVDGVTLPGVAALTEDTLALDFTQRFGADYRYVPGWGWLSWGGACWRRDLALCHFDDARKVARHYGDHPENPRGESRRLASARTVAAIVQLAHADRKLVMLPEAFDRLPYELNTPEAVFDLRDGSSRPRARGEPFMHSTAVAPEFRNIQRFAKFIAEITCGDLGLVRFLQQMLGACLFASTALADHWLAFLVGTGRNGKGTLIEQCAARAMGSYARRIPAEVLLADDRGTRHPTEIANLLGVRLAYASEIDEGRRWNESRLKELSGGDKLSGRFMRQDFFEFTPSHRLVIYANHRPTIPNPDAAFRARLKLVPFRADFSGREDTALPDQLADELPLILGWMIAGAADYWEAGRLRSCEAVQEASTAYFDLHSTFEAWIEERCNVAPDLEDRAKRLYDDFAEWKRQRNEGVLSMNRWADMMLTRFARRESHGIIYGGLALRP